MDATPKELQKIDVKQGTGAEAVTGKVVVVHYTGWLYDPAKPDNKGAKFDSSRDRSQAVRLSAWAAVGSSRAGTRAWPA